MPKQITVDFNAEFAKFFSSFQKAQARTEAGVMKLKNAVVQLASAYAVGNFFKESLNAYAEQEKALANLKAQLGFTSKALIDQASAIQKTTVYGDEAVNMVQAMIAAFTKDENTIKKLTAATVDLAAAKGMDLTAAADLVAKSFGSSTNALARYGIAAEGAAGSSQRLESLTKNISDLYGGIAAANADTYSGKMEQLKNRLGDIQENIGGALVPTILKLTDSLGQLIGEGERAAEIMGGLKIAGQFLGSVMVGLLGVIKHVATILGTLGAALAAVFMGDFNLVPIIVEQGFRKIVDNGKETVSAIGNMWKDDAKKVKDAEEKKRTTVIKTSKEEIDAVKKAQKDKADAIKKYYDSVKFLDDNYMAYRKAMTEQEILDLIKKGGSEIDAEKYRINESKKLNEEYIQYLNDLYGGKIEFNANGQMSGGASRGISTRRKQQGVNAGNNPLEGMNDAAIMEDWVRQSELASAAMDGFIYGAMDGLDQLRIKVADDANFMAKAFAGFANAAIQAIDQILAKWAVLNLFSALIGGPGIGLGKVLGLHEGGSVANIGGRISYSRVPRFSTGTDFIVPRGYPNDSYPILVESGERVTVTPASQVAGQSFSDRNIIGELRAVNNSIQALTVATIKSRSGAGYSGAGDVLKNLTELITSKQNENFRSNVKVR